MSDADRKSGDYLYLSIYRDLKKRLSDGEFKKGERFPPERRLKDEYDTTHVTVRKALSLLVEEGYIERYSGKGTVVVFSEGAAPTRNPVPPAAGIRSVRCLLPSLDWPRRRVLSDLAEHCSSIGLRMEAIPYPYSREEDLLADAIADGGSLILYEPQDPRVPYEVLLEPMANRVVLLGQGGETGALAGVFIDLERGMRECLAYLEDLGSGGIVLVGRSGTQWDDAFASAYSRSASAFGFSPDPVPRADGIGLPNGCDRTIQLILDENPDCRAFLCTDDLSAGVVASRLAEMGLAGNREFIVIGCGNDPFTEVVGLPSLDLNPDMTSRLLQGFLDEYHRNGAVKTSRYMIRPELVLRRRRSGAIR